MKYLLSLFFIFLLISPSFSAQKYNPITGEIIDYTGPFNAGTLTDGKLCTYESATQQIDCDTTPGAASAAGGLNAVQYNNPVGTLAGTEAAFSFNATNVGIGTSNGQALWHIASTANQVLAQIDDNGVNDPTPALWVKADGNVGIGTTNPGEIFVVGRLIGQRATFTQDSTTGMNVGIGTLSTTHGLYVNSKSGGVRLTVRTEDTSSGPSADLRVFNNETVGISIKMPSAATANPNAQITNTASVPFIITSTGDINFTTPTNVGMGTTIIGDQFIYKRGATAGSILMSDSVGLGTWIAASAVGGGGGSTSPGGGEAAVQYNSSNAFAGDATKFSFNGSNVGIGTSSAAKAFQVGTTAMFNVDSSTGLACLGTSCGLELSSASSAITKLGGAAFTGLSVNNLGLSAAATASIQNGSVAAASNLTFYGGGGTGSDIFFKSTSGTGNGTDDLVFATGTDGSIEAMRVKGANLGIGTVTPGTMLDVSGFIRSTSLTASKCVKTDATGTLISAAADCGSGGSSQWFTKTGTNGNVGIGTYDGIGIGTFMGNAALVVLPTPQGSNVGIGTWNPRSALETNGFQLTGNGVAASSVLVSNSTGIGTWMATTTLNVTATATPGGTPPAMQYNAAGSMGGITNWGSDGTNVGVGTTSFKNSLNMLGNIGIGTIKYDAYLIEAGVNGNMVVQGNIGIGTWKASNSLIVYAAGSGNGGGNIGIGTLAPGVALDVNGTTRISNSGDVYFGGNLGLGTTIPMGTLAVQGSIVQGTVAYTGRAVDTNTVAISGNVGIGTWNPLQQLVITGNVGIGTILSNTLMGNFSPPSPGGQLYVQGNLGVGTFAPSAVVNINSTAAVNLFRVDDNGNGDLDPFVIDQNGNVGIGTTNTQNDRLLIMGGNVGIGTWVPAAALDIKGGLRVFNSVSTVTLKTGANTSCQTTCGTTMAIGAFDTTVTPTPVSMSDASADSCYCLGP